MRHHLFLTRDGAAHTVSRWIPLVLLLAAVGAGVACSKDTPAATSKPPVTIDPDVFDTDHPELFKTAKGEYVAPAPIENLLNVHPMIELSMVSGVGQAAAYAMVVLAEELRPRLADAAESVRAQRQPDGTWLQARRHPGRVWFEVDAAAGEPSRWLTFFAIRALAWWDDAAPDSR